MDQNQFDELLNGVKLAGKVARDEEAPSRVFEYNPSNMKEIPTDTNPTDS